MAEAAGEPSLLRPAPAFTTMPGPLPPPPLGVALLRLLAFPLPPPDVAAVAAVVADEPDKLEPMDKKLSKTHIKNFTYLISGVNISPFFLDTCQGKGFGFHLIWGKVLRCKLGHSGFSINFGKNSQENVDYTRYVL